MNTLDEVKNYLLENNCDEAVVLEQPDYCTAFIGVTTDGKAVYDYDAMVDFLVNTDHMSAEEAIEFIDYNTVRSLPYAGDKAPIIIERIIE